MSKSKPEQAKQAKSGRGGARPGAGRKAKWGQKTVVMRVPEGLRDEVEEFIRLRSTGCVFMREDEVEARVAQAVQEAISSTQTMTEAEKKPKPRKKAASRKKQVLVVANEQASLFDLDAFM